MASGSFSSLFRDRSLVMSGGVEGGKPKINFNPPLILLTPLLMWKKILRASPKKTFKFYDPPPSLYPTSFCDVLKLTKLQDYMMVTPDDVDSDL